MDNFKPTHYGLFMGIVPIILDLTNEAEPVIEGRWFWCNPLLTVTEYVFGMFCMVATMINPDFEPMFAMKITGEIHG